ncbi:protein FANTASTIC FOUR 1-like [Aristolochia californica]|uniref:protein FANTASTIC FOUR 1-like n=1 Tax=Aristolochia californica TaxID=171875 RepID=UPI0035DC73D1
MSFCKSFQTLFGLSDVDDRRHFSLPSPGGLCLIARKFQKPANVVESSAVGKNSGDKEDDALTFDDEGGRDGDGDGFLTCTETLGSESSDERVATREGIDERGVVAVREDQMDRERWIRKSRLQSRKMETKFPPPLPGLDPKGRSRSFLKADRKDGRVLLTEVRIERPEVFCAKREGGRLRLQVVKSTQRIEEENEDEHKEEENKEEKREAERREEEEEHCGKWEFHFQRCHHLGNHFSSIWISRCVTTS